MADAASPSSANPAGDLIEGFNNLNLIRQAGLMVGLAASVAIGFAVVLWSQGEDYKPLYGSLDRLDSAEVGQVLDFNDIPYKIDGSTGALLVPVDKLQKARILLAENGIQGDKTIGFELLDQEQPLGTSQFMEATRYRRSLEGELARTIASINSVRSARVHLAIPKRSVFVRDGREPSASVFLDLYPGRPIKPKQIAGIANLVAASIPELDSTNVTIVDQKGNLMEVAPEDEKLAQASQHLDYTRKVEDDIVLRIRRLLTPIIGDANFKTEVAADLDFTEMEQAAETFNPDLPAIRSEQTSEEQRIGAGGPGGIPGALTNQPPADGAAPEVAVPGGGGDGQTPPQQSQSRATRNYELDRTVSYTKHQKGRLRRLTVAVVVDDKVQRNAETGEATRVPWTEAELERLAILVRDAVGFSAARGDSVNVLNEPFVAQLDFDSGDLPIWKEDWFLSLAKQLAGFLIIVALILGLMRPVLKSLAGAGAKTKAEEEAKELEALQAAGIDSFDSLSDETVTLTGGDALALPSPEETYEQQLNAVKGLVAEDPGRVAQVIKRWINEE
ncbi:flagellar basal-body MS-ring/collar protein FliF [Teredinibacter turnerae]|uniref:Flagellar M-ring protein n=1 Tax=Teredinibacter turnerae (strain ATCC 39867 / T7901) TaxID=377629 RepID=C5BSE1_TERTT|nr:flagellar basal-body MS-ring/collar protein FliF [Teredinibacter turnerae]ACR11256.1 flagellar M-ring protein FliF [Teredinibacter turnerae T7901]